ncbi:MAG: hypothetical protein HN394_01250 [Rhodospirillaceae bacterium]|nr:hypothetical protein [Rhodospirillaceae bacterium]MBT4085490.1 hypothetical protein [Alphaproteobacteria bacterium]MBT4691681.1 hypothetical protein [Rhodospirillaceae bacterium]MBT6218542.1 hypothetical protein [Rhodospirillaceae bacterium]MBT6588683.1 hypothetical protein [Rhodospirillaceae bacterium]
MPALVRHETNTFSTLPIPLRAFDLKSGQSTVQIYRRINNPAAIFREIIEREGAEYVVPMIANSNPSGAMNRYRF